MTSCSFVTLFKVDSVFQSIALTKVSRGSAEATQRMRRKLKRKEVFMRRLNLI